APAAAAERTLEVAASYIWMQPSGDTTVLAGNPAEEHELALSSDTGYGVSGLLFFGNFAAELSVAQIESSLEIAAADDEPRPAAPSRSRIMPVTLALQYHFAPDAMIDPYIGVGAMTIMTSDPEDIPTTGVAVTAFEADDYGYLVSAGLAVEMTETIGVILDAKYVPSGIATRATINTPAGTTADIDMNPIMVSIGVSWRWGR
ncbi:MAG TPA: OmpW family outer membrane protein, partial [Thermoanaerobaculia bacterium]